MTSAACPQPPPHATSCRYSRAVEVYGVSRTQIEADVRAGKIRVRRFGEAGRSILLCVEDLERCYGFSEPERPKAKRVRLSAKEEAFLREVRA